MRAVDIEALGPEPDLPPITPQATEHFPSGTMMHTVESHHTVGLLSRQRAIIVGGTDPINYIGTSDHTREADKAAPYKRLVRTGIVFEEVLLGSRAKADAMLERVHRQHSTVEGETTEAAGPYPAGTEHSASKLPNMLWTVAVMADSSEVLYEATVGPLTRREREDLWRDWLHFGELFKMPIDEAPQTYAEFREYYEGRFRSGELYLTESAKFMGVDICRNMPFPPALVPLRQVVDLVLRGSMPEQVRDMYELPFSGRDEKAFKRVTAAMRAGNALLPRSLTHGRNLYFLKGVAKAERDLIAQGTAIQMPSDPYRLTAEPDVQKLTSF
jgi:uncharacterized protein (DUF2236 family)